MNKFIDRLDKNINGIQLGLLREFIHKKLNSATCQQIDLDIKRLKDAITILESIKYDINKGVYDD